MRLQSRFGRKEAENLAEKHRTLKDNNLKVRALRRARELREVSASLFFLALFPFTSVHSTIKPLLSTIMVGKLKEVLICEIRSIT